MRSTGLPRQPIALAASLLLCGLTGCVYGPHGPYLDPYFSGACSNGTCPSNYGNSWYDTEGTPPLSHGPYSETYDPSGEGEYACDDCGSDAHAYASTAEQPSGPVQSRFHLVPSRPVFSDYRPATYATPMSVGPDPSDEIDTPSMETMPRRLPEAAPGVLPPPPTEIPMSDRAEREGNFTQVPQRARRRGDSWIFLPLQSPRGTSAPLGRVASPRRVQLWK